MKNLFLGIIILGLSTACNSNRSNTEADREATYVEKGDTINPIEGAGEGTAGKQYMETVSEDSTKEVEQQLR